ncbi:MAG: hypothetical protein JWQ75_4062 [Pseudarthrobacter sp.]|nr:hypothetical protein [Pseudarthrobacter sp.]
MMHQTSDKKWFDELILELRLRQVHGDAIGDTVASARELLDDTGQRADEAFGPARDYAAALELPAAPPYDWVRGALWPGLLGLLAFLLFNQAVVAWVRSELLLVSPAQLAFAATPVVLIACLPLYLTAAVRRTWLLVVLVAVCAVAGVLSAVVTPTAEADAWLAINPLPWLIVSAVAMVVLSIMNTIRSRRPGSREEITDPRSGAERSNGTGAQIMVLVTNWLFPICALAMLGLALVMR